MRQATIIPLILVLSTGCHTATDETMAYDETQEHTGAVAQAATGPLPTPGFGAPIGAARFGAAVINAGDLDGDGNPDMIIGAPGSNFGAGANEGAVYAYNATGALWRSVGATAGARKGASLDVIGDITGDGVAEILVGLPGFNSGGFPIPDGAFELLDGATGAVISSMPGGAGVLNSGTSVRALPGAGPAGAMRFAVGAPGAGGGLVTVYDLPSNIAYTVTGGANFGSGIERLGDLDGDLITEFVVLSAPVGAALPLCLGPAPVVATNLSIVTSTTEALFAALPGSFTSMVSLGSDYDGDGVSDVLLGAPSANSVSFAGTATAAVAFPFGAPSDCYGAAVEAADIGGDGVSEAIIGAPQPASGVGFVEVRDGLTGVVSATYTGGTLGEAYGSAIAAGDFDGDGEIELVIGAPGPGALGGRVEFR